MLNPVEAWWVGLCVRSFDKLRMTGPLDELEEKKPGPCAIPSLGKGRKGVLQRWLNFIKI
jgi:hypothetical protein